MPKMVSLEMPKPKKESKTDMPSPMMDQKYPYGTRVELRDEMVKKFGCLKDCSVGDEVMITAKGKITMMRSEERQGDNDKNPKENSSVDIQLTDMSMAMDDDGAMDKGFDEASKDTKED